MVQERAQAPSGGPGKHLVLYDGVCGMCNGLLQFVLPRDRRVVFRFAALQSATAKAIVERSGDDSGDLATFYVVENYQTPAARVLTRSRAGLFVLDALGWPWKAAAIIGVLPTAWLDAAYDIVARHRYRVFGRHDRCLLPRPEYRDRFIDTGSKTA
jgi:predicted DCC family thiol-disulfide oxidoreductase YuxK